MLNLRKSRKPNKASFFHAESYRQGFLALPYAHMHKPPRGVSGYSTDCAKRKGNLLMVTTAPYNLFPIDGNGNPPTEEEICKEIETIIKL